MLPSAIHTVLAHSFLYFKSYLVVLRYLIHQSPPQRYRVRNAVLGLNEGMEEVVKQVRRNA